MTDSNETLITNADRAERMHGVLESYNAEYDVQANLIDMLADARHWCDRHGLGFASLDRIAHDHYLHEWAAEDGRCV